MANYQLSKTNVFLGGQLKWNLQIESRKDELFIHDFFLSPISKWVNFSRPDDRVFNYTHEENLVRFYKSIQSNFFEPVTDPKLQIKTPIVTDDFEYENTYCDEYDMGLSRASVKMLGKSLQILCPLWLEDFNETNNISFEIEVYTKEKTEEIVVDEYGNSKKETVYKDNVITSEILNLTLSGQNIHDEFVNYFNNYIKNITDNGSIGDKVINIDFKNSKMIADGINLNTGKLDSKNVSYILPNLSSRYRPMMDTDNIIISSFYNNELICKQLFNFNLIFNIEDILSPSVHNQLIGSKLFFNIKAKVDGLDLPVKSFSTDYSKEFEIGNSKIDNITLSTFEDYKYIGLIDKNKITRNIIHWSLTKDNDYIFNLYPKANLNTNIWSEEATYDKNCLNWCNNDILYGNVISCAQDTVNNWVFTVDDGKTCITCDKYNIIDKIRGISSQYYTAFDIGDIFINNILYKNENKRKIYLYINVIEGFEGFLNDSTYGRFPSDSQLVYLKDGTTVCGCIYSMSNNHHNIMIDKDHINVVTYKYITGEVKLKGKTTLDEAMYRYNYATGDIARTTNSSMLLSKQYVDDNGDSHYFEFGKLLNNVVDPIILPFNNSIVKIPQDFNDKQYSTTEINYKKILIPNNYLFRYDGLIKPNFVNFPHLFNEDYIIRKITTKEYNEDTSNVGWKKLLKKGIPATYPSIDYYYLDKRDNIDDEYIYNSKIETHSYNNSFVYVLLNEINLNIVIDRSKDKRSVKENIKNIIKYYYNINDNKLLDYIYNLYEYELTFDYIDNDINMYKYYIKLKLK